VKTISCGALQLLEAAHCGKAHLDQYTLTAEDRQRVTEYAQQYEAICGLIAEGIVTVVHEENTHREEI
jgi:glutamate 5-kinase